MYHHPQTDTLYIGDVGFGDTGTSERVFALPNLTTAPAGAAAPDFGWPCVEGVRSYVLGDMAILDGPFERVRSQVFWSSLLNTRANGV